VSDFGTRLALWSMQGRRHCFHCGTRVYTSIEPGGQESLQHVDTDIKARPHIPRSAK
jgi:hypothetical protein